MARLTRKESQARANFKSKEDLFLAMLDERFAQRMEELDRVLDGGASVEDRRHRVSRPRRAS